MRTRLYYLVVSLLTASPMLAQTSEHWQPYIRAGIGMSHAIGEAISSTGGVVYTYDYYSGMNLTARPDKLGGSQWLLVGNVGAGVTIPVSEYFTIQSEINIEQKGSATTVTKVTFDTRYIICDPGPCNYPSNIPANGQFSSRLTYLTIPVMGCYQFRKLTLALGPYISYKLGERVNGAFTFQNSVDSHPIASAVNTYKKVDWGISAGATYAITRLVNVDLRYSQGLLHIAEPIPGGYGTYTETSYNQSAQLAVRYNLLR